MPIDILMPALSPTMTEGTLAKWHKKEGDAVAAGDVIAEIETDKATMEVEAVDEGTIGKILVNEGTSGVAVNTPIAVLLEEGESAGVVKSGAKPATPPKAPPVKSPSPVGASAPTLSPLREREGPAKREGEGRVFASPLAKRLAAEKGIDLSSVHGSGPHGRTVRADLDGAHAAPKAAGHQAPAAAPKAAPSAPVARAAAPSGPDAKQLADLLGQKYKAVPNNNIRKVVAKRLLESKQTVPHFYLTVEYKIDALLRSRAELNEQGNGRFKLSVNDFIIKACANALKKYPAANAAWTDDAILLYENADISVAVATPNGLMTPIVKQAESKGLREISEEVKDLAARARDGKLKPEEFQGGSFTVSNLGMYGIESFGAIINPPQACILAVGAGVQKPYVEDGQVKIGTFMHCTLSVDHRAVDGAVGAEFLQVLKQFVEMPSAMLL